MRGPNLPVTSSPLSTNNAAISGGSDIDLITETDGNLRVKVNDVDGFKPQTGEVISDSTDGIACWFIDTDYNEEGLFARHTYFHAANDPYSTLKPEINPEPGPPSTTSLEPLISQSLVTSQ